MTPKSRSWWAEHYRLILVIIFLIAAVLRIYGLNNLSPPGLAHDEVAHWLINQDILNGNYRLYFIDAFGHEAGYHYLQTLFMVLLGNNAFVLRLPSAFAGLMLVAINFTLSRRLFGLRMALVAAAILAVLFWPVFYSRLGLRAISLPLLSGLSAYFWWRGWDDGEIANHKRKSRLIIQSPLAWYLLAGAFAGFSFYTYMASRVVPIFYLLFTFYLAIFHRPDLKKRWREVLLFFLVYAVVAAPLAFYLLSNPGAEVRIAEVDFPLEKLVNGDLEPVIINSIKFLGMFGFRGDPLWRNNVAHLPVFDLLVALFFYIGLLISLWRWQKQRYLFIVLWLFTAAIPSIVTIDAPSSIRIINALPILTLFPAIGLEVIQFFRPLSTVLGNLSPKIGEFLALLLLIALLGVNIARTMSAIFYVWPSNTEVQFVWQQAMTEIADYLEASEGEEATALGGWTPESMDPPTMDLLLQRDDLNLRYFEPPQALLIPNVPSGESSHIFLPTVLPLEPVLADRLAGWGAKQETIGSFRLVQIHDSPVIQPQFPDGTIFSNEIAFLGYDIVGSSDLVGPVKEVSEGADAINLVTYWRVVAPENEPRRFFLHAIAGDGQIVAQDDRIGAPANYWQIGDTIIQRHSIQVAQNEGPVIYILGIYDPETGQRLSTRDGADHVQLEVGYPGE